MPPDDWCRTLVLDPGHTVCCVLLEATPPPSLGDYRVIYDMLYLERADADRVARELYPRVAGRKFRQFIIDLRAGRQTPMGFGKTVWIISILLPKRRSLATP